MFQFSVAKAAVAFATAAMTVATAAPAFAQYYPPPPSQGGYYDAQGGYYYDPCRRDRNNRAVAGAVVGGILGAVIGSNVAARGVRTEGAVLGGGVGALGGAAVGANSAACAPNQSYPRSSYYNNGYGGGGYARGYDERYDGGYYGSRYNGGYYGSRYDGGYGARAGLDNDWDDEDAYAYDGGGRAYPIAEGSIGADGCALAESSIYMPDGRVQKRLVRVCRDRSGRYQVVE